MPDFDSIEIDENQEAEQQRQQCRRRRAIQHDGNGRCVLAHALELHGHQRVQQQLILPIEVLGEHAGRHYGAFGGGREVLFREAEALARADELELDQLEAIVGQRAAQVAVDRFSQCRIAPDESVLGLDQRGFGRRQVLDHAIELGDHARHDERHERAEDDEEAHVDDGDSGPMRQPQASHADFGERRGDDREHERQEHDREKIPQQPQEQEQDDPDDNAAIALIKLVETEGRHCFEDSVIDASRRAHDPTCRLPSCSTRTSCRTARARGSPRSGEFRPFRP